MNTQKDHPNTDLHRAGCPSCQMAYDKKLPDAQAPQKPAHYICGSGSHGCLYDNGPHAHATLDDAVEDLTDFFGLGRTRKARLKKDRYLQLIPTINEEPFGADYCEITICDCSRPWGHNEDDKPENWPDYPQP